MRRGGVGVFFLFFWFSLSSVCFASLRFSVEEISSWIEEYREKGSLQIAPEITESAKKLHYVLVCGFLNELPFKYYKHLVATLLELGVPSNHIHIIQPPSNQSIRENVSVVGRAIESLKIEEPESIVLLGHSKGADEAVAYALMNPEFVKEKVLSIVAIQGAFGGSLLADFFMSPSPVLPETMPKFHRKLLSFVSRALGPLVRRCFQSGLKSLTPTQCEAFWEDLREHYAGSIDIVAEKLVYLQAKIHPEEMTQLRPFGWYLHAQGIASDGMVSLKGQMLPWLAPQHCGTFLTDHGGFTHGWPKTGQLRFFRKAFATALFRASGVQALAGALP